MTFVQETIDELAASIREHGVLQPILVRPHGPSRFQLVAGERRWRASKLAGLTTIPALIEEIDDETALEIAIIENLQREDLSPLDEAAMYDRMIREHGYSIRKLAEKLGKDKGYLENRLRLADAPPEIRELVSLRKDTLSHAYELLKVERPAEAPPAGRAGRPWRALAGQAARARSRADRRGPGRRPVADDGDSRGRVAGSGHRRSGADATDAWTAPRRGPLSDDSLVDGQAAARRRGRGAGRRAPRARPSWSPSASVDRANLAKYLTIAKLRLENAIAMVRSGEPRE